MMLLGDHARFAFQMIRHPRSTGAVAPSGKKLARTMVAGLGTLEPGAVIVELGPGTGVFTRQMCCDRPENAVLAIERSPSFAQQLRQSNIDAIIIEGCATEISKHVRKALPKTDIAGVLSGLPLLSLPPAIRDNIFDAIREALQPGQRYVQFTYSRRSWQKFDLPEVTADRAKTGVA